MTAKRLPRYVSIFQVFKNRFDFGDMTAVTYLCNAESARAVREALRTLMPGRAISDRVHVHEVFDPAGHWTGDELPVWLPAASTVAAKKAR